MALRSLVCKMMKAVPRGVPASRAFADARKPDPKLMNDPLSKIAAEPRGTSQYRSTRNLRRTNGTNMEKESKRRILEQQRRERELGNLEAKALLVLAGCVAAVLCAEEAEEPAD